MRPATSPAPTAVVGHVEWVTHAFGSPPVPGAIADLRDPIREPAGGGGVAAAAIARACGPAVLLTALGNDDAAADCARGLDRPGLEMVAAHRDAPQTPVLSITGPDAERTIMVVGPRLQPRGGDRIDWQRVAGCAACYYAGEDPDALVHARTAPTLVVTARRLADVRAAGVRPDVLVASAADPDEHAVGLPDALRPEWLVLTDGARGGTVVAADGSRWTYAAATPPGPVLDAYGCGDTFAGCLAAWLGRGADMPAAIAAASAEAARCATWRGGLGPVR